MEVADWADLFILSLWHHVFITKSQLAMTLMNNISLLFYCFYKNASF